MTISNGSCHSTNDNNNNNITTDGKVNTDDGTKLPIINNKTQQQQQKSSSSSSSDSDVVAVVKSSYNTTNESIEVQPQLLLHPKIVLQENIPYIILCIAILHGIYVYCYNTYAYHKTMLFGILHIPSINDCNTMRNENTIHIENDKCGRPDLFAFQMVSGIVFIVVSIFGLYAWYHHTTTGTVSTNVTKDNKYYILSTPSSRLYGYQYEAHVILLINLSYQIWDFFISILAIPEYNTIIMLLHHIIAAIVAYYGLYNYMFSYYAVFFLGLSEISSIFLVSLDLYKYFIPPTGTTTTSTSSNLLFLYSQHIAGPSFVITFIYYRIYLWYFVSHRLWSDVHTVTAQSPTTTSALTTTSSTATTNNNTPTTAVTSTTTHNQSLTEQLRPNRTYVLYIWLYANIPMGVLQYYFLSIILYEIYQKFFLKL